MLSGKYFKSYLPKTSKSAILSLQKVTYQEMVPKHPTAREVGRIQSDILGTIRFLMFILPNDVMQMRRREEISNAVVKSATPQMHSINLEYFGSFALIRFLQRGDVLTTPSPCCLF